MTPHATDVTQQVLWMTITIMVIIAIGLFLSFAGTTIGGPGWG
jgi:hypothetical protein